MTDRAILTPYFIDRQSPRLEQLLARPEWQINRVELPAGTAQERLIPLYQPLAAFVAETVARGQRPVSLAGDCCTSLGVLAGLQRASLSPTLIWFDAHGDFNTWETTPSGFLGGMPLAMLVGRGEQSIAAGLDLRPLPEAQVILTDARDLDPGEREAVAGSAVTHLPAVEMLLDHPLPAGPLYTHFDTDVINPDEAPAMSYRTAGGPSAATLHRAFGRLAATGQIAAVSFSSWNPDLDPDGRTQAVCLELLQTLLAG
ncbi:MAG: arginase family protein [Chloroflexi bacterium]|nr:arginase family protein [Chloroflexota bacterium]MCI0580589.1 arginase family protein [Chloroflexota bacterium]MCI0648889.1 arginase family protein [Chloroflexota bacterium]MCI0728219.1 arginase family protein [Chloroflexota bacterium]